MYLPYSNFLPSFGSYVPIFKSSYIIPSETRTLSLSTGFSTIKVSVVRTKPAIEAAFCSADLVTLAGSIIPASIIFTILPVVIITVLVTLMNRMSVIILTRPSKQIVRYLSIRYKYLREFFAFWR